MRCSKCESEWVSKNSIINKCPFCGADLIEEQSGRPASFSNSAEVLRYIGEKYGADILLGRKLKGYISDLAPTLPDNVKKLIGSLYEMGASDKLMAALNGSDDDKKEAALKGVSRLTDSFVSEEAAVRIINEMTAALGWPSAEINCVKKTESVSYSEVNESELSAEEMNDIGNNYYDGINGFEQDYEKALEWFKKGAALGGADAQDSIGTCYLQGKGVPKNYRKAAEWYRKAAEQGNADAQYCLAFIILYYIDDYEEEEAVKWLKLAAEQDMASAQSELGLCYLNGTGTSVDMKKAEKWLKRAAEQDHSYAQCRLGVLYFDNSDFKKAVFWLKKAAEKNEYDAMTYLGVCYTQGNGVEQNIKKGLDLIYKAADNGCENARTILNDYNYSDDDDDDDYYSDDEDDDDNDHYSDDEDDDDNDHYSDDEDDDEEEMSFDEMMNYERIHKERVDQLIKTQNIENVWTLISQKDTYAEYALEQYYKAMTRSFIEARKLETLMSRLKVLEDRFDKKTYAGFYACYVYSAILHDYFTTETIKDHEMINELVTAIRSVAHEGVISAIAKIGFWGSNEYYNATNTKKEGVAYLVIAAQKKHPTALAWLGSYFRTGENVPERNLNQAREYLELGALYGQPYAVKELGKLNSGSYSPSSGCYITTAALSSLGKNDSCTELQQFRNFRDNWLLNQTDGKEIITEYYRTAPRIVDNINKQNNSAEIYSNIWENYLEKCLQLIDKKDYNACKKHYISMVLHLKELYY